MTLDEFIAKLEADPEQRIERSGGTYKAFCPAHDDRREQSLGIKEGEDGRILLTCYAGCSTPDVVEGFGLQMRDLFPGNTRQDELPEAVYEYTDEQGNVLFQALRFSGKRFRQRHYDPTHPDAKDDGWVWNLEDVRRVPFRLPELIAAVAAGKRVYITEGEKDAQRITQETGRFATCNPMGAGKWRDEFNGFFAGAGVTIIQDRDEPGRRHARRVKEALDPVAAEVLILQAAQGKDMSDHFDAGLPMEGLLRPRATPARGIINAAQMAESGLEYLAYRPVDLPGWALLPGVEATIVRQGRLYVVGAYTGDGKTTLALQGARTLCQQGKSVGYFSMEMSDIDLRNRFIAHRGVPLYLLERPWELRENPEALALYHLALEEMRDWKLEVIYDTTLKPERIVQDTYDREYEFVVIDHLHRLGWGDRRHLETSILALTNLTLDANIPMLVLCQLRRYQRGKDTVAYPPPVLQDFRETEMIGNEASLALALWRQRDETGIRYMGTSSQLTVLKNRHTTTRKDRAGHIETLDFDTTTQLYTPGGITSATRDPDPAEAVIEPDDTAWE